MPKLFTSLIILSSLLLSLSLIFSQPVEIENDTPINESTEPTRNSNYSPPL